MFKSLCSGVFASSSVGTWQQTATADSLKIGAETLVRTLAIGDLLNFSNFSLHAKLNTNIDALGFVEPTPIQERSIPEIIKGGDLMGLAQTGTGKTAAFGLPILQRLIEGQRGHIRALVLAPTRELAEQIHETIQALGRKTGVRSATIYGGVSFRSQLAQIRRGFEIAVACPGRLLDHLERRTIDLSHVEVVVLDEADRMLDMGFLPPIRKIVQGLPRERQTLLFSATMPNDVRRLSRELLQNPKTVEIDQSVPIETVEHAIYSVSSPRKTALLIEMLNRASEGSILVFTRTKHRAQRLAEQLGNSGHSVTSIQGNLSQPQRQKALQGFRSGRFRILVATDIAARGIDVSTISHVINYDIPDTTDAYLHRIGRTGRAKRTGEAFTMVTHEDHAMVRAIERVLRKPLERRNFEGFVDNTHPPASRPKPIGAGRPRRAHNAGKPSPRTPQRRRTAW